MAAPYTAPTMHILLLEDDRTLAAAVLAYLHTKHYQVDWADSLAQARPLIGVNHYWAVLLDLNLPDGDGLTLLPQLRSAPDRPTVIAVTARDQVSDRIRGLDAGADDYLVKPYDPEELLARLRAIERRRSQQAAAQVVRGSVHIEHSLARHGAEKLWKSLHKEDFVNALGALPHLSTTGAPLPGADDWRDQVGAGLESLGWSAKDAAAAVEGIAPLREENPTLGIGELMRAALQSLAR